MEGIVAMLLSLCLLLSGCAQGAAPGPGGGAEPPAAEALSEVPEGNGDDTSSPAGGGESAAAPETVSFEQLALRLSELPDLPEEPDETALWQELDRLDSKDYAQASQSLWEEFYSRQAEYREAVKVLRGEGVDRSLVPELADYTLRTAKELLGDERERNAVYSPACLYLALCMLAETTGGESRDQILGLLGLDDLAQTRETANALWRELYRDGSTGKTLLADSLWLNDRLDYQEATVDRLAESYLASTFRAPMGDRETDRAIAAWIDAATNGLLSDAAAGLETKPDTLMLLISALYFKGTWADQFDKSATWEDTFTDAQGREQTVSFMHRSERGVCYRGDRYTAASLPFLDGTAMWFLLPDRGVTPQDALLGSSPFVSDAAASESAVPPALATEFGTVAATEERAEIQWSVPRFDVSSDLDLIPQLESLGVTDVFGSAADFSPLTELEAAVSAVKHAARVKVDEEGCEAAAFTAITAECTSAMPEQLPVVEMDLDRPFGFLITGTDGLPLFVGIVNTMG